MPPSRTRVLPALAVLTLLVLTLGACGDGAARVAKDTSAPAPAPAPTPPAASGGGPGDSDVFTATATSLAAVPGSTLLAVERDELGAYDVTVATADGVGQDLEIAEDAVTITAGPVRHPGDPGDPAQVRRLLDAPLGHEDAALAGTGSLPSSVTGLVTGLALDEEDGVVVWRVEYSGDTNRQTSIDVDATTGAVLGTERDD